MKAEQVFSCYDYSGNLGISNANYCIVCGTKLKLVEDGGRKRPCCPKCGYVFYKNPSPAVSVLVRNEKNQILLGRRASKSTFEKRWCLPCGFIEFDEDFLTGAIREVEEETGLRIRINSLVSVVTNYLTPAIHSLVIVMLADIVDGVPTPGDDIEELMWISKGEPLPEMAFEADRHIIERYYEGKMPEAQVDERYSKLK